MDSKRQSTQCIHGHALGRSLYRFFGFLRAGEFKTPSENAYDPQVHLSLSDLALDSHTAPTTISLRIKQSKTDPFRVGVNIFLGATRSDVCPVQAKIQYLAVRPSEPGPLFITGAEAPLTRALMVKERCNPEEFLLLDTMGIAFELGRQPQQQHVVLRTP